jgi:hypothetical protein
MSSIMVQIKDINENPDLIRHMVFNMIRRYNVEYREQFGETIICFDSKNNWRKETFPEYKANRKKNREESDVDWSMIFDIIGEVKENLKTFSPYRCIEVERCEADDIIGTICEKQMSPEPILIISPDRDFVQLQRYPNVKQFSNVQKKWVEPKEGSALDDLALKILQGDTGDGVPNVLSDDTTLAEGRRQGVLSKKKKEALLEDPQALGTTVARQYIRNKTMIDLTSTPDDLQEQIMAEFQKPANGSIMRLMTLFTKNRMNLLTESLSDFEVRTL